LTNVGWRTLTTPVGFEIEPTTTAEGVGAGGGRGLVLGTGGGVTGGRGPAGVGERVLVVVGEGVLEVGGVAVGLGVGAAKPSGGSVPKQKMSTCRRDFSHDRGKQQPDPEDRKGYRSRRESANGLTARHDDLPVDLWRNQRAVGREAQHTRTDTEKALGSERLRVLVIHPGDKASGS
jgi:hypothetical protein